MPTAWGARCYTIVIQCHSASSSELIFLIALTEESSEADSSGRGMPRQESPPGRGAPPRDCWWCRPLSPGEARSDTKRTASGLLPAESWTWILACASQLNVAVDRKLGARRHKKCIVSSLLHCNQLSQPKPGSSLTCHKLRCWQTSKLRVVKMIRLLSVHERLCLHTPVRLGIKAPLRARCAAMAGCRSRKMMCTSEGCPGADRTCGRPRLACQQCFAVTAACSLCH